MRDRRQQREGCCRRVAPGNSDCSGACQLVPLSGQLRQPVRPGAGVSRLVEPLPQPQPRTVENRPRSRSPGCRDAVAPRLHQKRRVAERGRPHRDRQHLRRCLRHQPISQRSQLWMMLARGVFRHWRLPSRPRSPPGDVQAAAGATLRLHNQWHLLPQPVTVTRMSMP